MIKHSEVVKRYGTFKGAVDKPFISDDEARQLMKNLTKTSKQYIKLKKQEVEKDGCYKLKDDEYRVFRDCVLAEVCKIELQDPNIRKSHNMEPAV